MAVWVVDDPNTRSTCFTAAINILASLQTEVDRQSFFEAADDVAWKLTQPGAEKALERFTADPLIEATLSKLSADDQSRYRTLQSYVNASQKTLPMDSSM
jgi:hypothetical protein